MTRRSFLVGMLAQAQLRSLGDATEYLRIFEHRCPGCNRAFVGEAAFLDFLRHLDYDLACRHEFDEFLDAVREDAGGS
jgi:hypothetical protein